MKRKRWLAYDLDTIVCSTVFDIEFDHTEPKRVRTCFVPHKRGREAFAVDLYSIEAVDCKRVRIGAESEFLCIDDPKVQLAEYRKIHAYKSAWIRQEEGSKRPTMRALRDKEFVHLWYGEVNYLLWKCAQVRSDRYGMMDCS